MFCTVFILNFSNVAIILIFNKEACFRRKQDDKIDEFTNYKFFNLIFK